MKVIILTLLLLVLNGCDGCRNTANPNSSSVSDTDEPIRGAYDSGNEPATPTSTVPKDTIQNDSLKPSN